MKLLIVGVGYVGSRVLKEFRGKCDKIWGTTRRDVLLTDSDIVTFDESSPIRAQIIEEATHILQTIPPVEGEDLLLKHHKQQLIQSENLRWIGYCSTTGVYGDTHGGWVTESSPCFPAQRRSIERKHIEDQWIELWRSCALPIHIFRLSGIYGPHRSQIRSVLAGKARRIVKQGQVFSRIHVDDIVQILKASMENPQSGEIYNAADDFACSSNEIIEYICQELNLSLPPEVSVNSDEVSEMARSFYAECRRVSNGKIKKELGIILKYPTYQQGLKDELKALKGNS